MLVANKRNYPIAIQRNGFRNKGKLFSESAVMMRCVRDNHSVALIHLHYLESATISMSIQVELSLTQETWAGRSCSSDASSSTFRWSSSSSA